jgi:uncharacterized protein (DUF58 family)
VITISDRGYWLIGLIIITGIVGQWVGPGQSWSAVAANLWTLPTALLVAAVFAESAALPASKLRITRDVPQQADLGEKFTIKLVFANDGQRSVCIQCQPSHPESFSADSKLTRYRVPPGQSVTDYYELLPLELGKTGPGDLHIRILGFIGLIWWYRCIEDDAEVQVVPDSINSISRGAGERHAGTSFSRKPIQGGMEFLVHRQYQQGDPMQSVDWKATARSNEMMVRVMTREQRMEMAVLLDCGRTSQLQAGKLSQLHHNVNVVARLSELAVSHGDHIACITYADRPLSMMKLTSGIRGLRNTREILKNTRSVTSESNLLAAALQARRLLGHRALVVILTDLSNADEASQFSRAVRLLSAKHRVVIASIDDTEILHMRWSQASHWMDPYRNFAALEYCRERQLTKMKLKQVGASVITAAPAKMDKAVLDYYRILRQRAAV